MKRVRKRPFQNSQENLIVCLGRTRMKKHCGRMQSQRLSNWCGFLRIYMNVGHNKVMDIILYKVCVDDITFMSILDDKRDALRYSSVIGEVERRLAATKTIDFSDNVISSVRLLLFPILWPYQIVEDIPVWMSMTEVTPSCMEGISIIKLMLRASGILLAQRGSN